MTKIVNKGANRAAHTAKVNRHAQRTPLPPKPGVVESARQPVEAASSNGEGPDDRSAAKAQDFGAKALSLGWGVDYAPNGEVAELTATRGVETIVQAWSGGVWQYDASVYAYGDRNTKPRNASGASKLLARSEKDAAAEMAKVTSNRSFRRAEPKDLAQTLEAAQKALPFDPELATDEEVTGVLNGQALVWYNRMSGGNESALVSRKGVRITRLPDGARVANFCCPVTGFRSCLVTSILRVGRGKAVKAEAALVEVA